METNDTLAIVEIPDGVASGQNAERQWRQHLGHLTRIQTSNRSQRAERRKAMETELQKFIVGASTWCSQRAERRKAMETTGDLNVTVFTELK